MRYRLQAIHGTPNPSTTVSLPLRGWFDTRDLAKDAPRAYEENNWDTKVLIHDERDWNFDRATGVLEATLRTRNGTLQATRACGSSRYDRR